VALW